MTVPAGPHEGADDYEGSAGDDADAMDLGQEERLDLDEDDDLPWLEDDAAYEEEGGFDARLIWFALLGLAAIIALLAAAWYFTRDGVDPELAEAGSTIAAPDGPYKERPEDPGGREVEGTGDTAYQVAEGESQRGRVADNAPRPSIDRDQAGAAGDRDGDADEGEPAAAETPAASGDAVYVQIGAFTSREDANAGLANARNRYSAISGMRHRIVEAEVNGAKVYRLQIVAGNRAAGDATCRAIRNAGGDCYIR